MDNDLYRRYRFFKANAGYVVGERAKLALDLARAEKLAEAYGLAVDWEWEDMDPSAFWGDFDKCGGYVDVCARCGRSHGDCVSPEGHEYHNHEITYALVRAPGGEVFASLGGVVDAIGTPYQRVVEAELLAEAIAEINRNEYTLPIVA